MTLKTNENGIDRDMTADEETAYLAHSAEIAAKTKALKDAENAKQIARQAVITKLGLTADEAAALLG